MKAYSPARAIGWFARAGRRSVKLKLPPMDFRPTIASRSTVNRMRPPPTRDFRTPRAFSERHPKSWDRSDRCEVDRAARGGALGGTVKPVENFRGFGRDPNPILHNPRSRLYSLSGLTRPAAISARPRSRDASVLASSGGPSTSVASRRSSNKTRKLGLVLRQFVIQMR